MQRSPYERPSCFGHRGLMPLRWQLQLHKLHTCFTCSISAQSLQQQLHPFIQGLHHCIGAGLQSLPPSPLATTISHAHQMRITKNMEGWPRYKPLTNAEDYTAKHMSERELEMTRHFHHLVELVHSGLLLLYQLFPPLMQCCVQVRLESSAGCVLLAFCTPFHADALGRCGRCPRSAVVFRGSGRSGRLAPLASSRIT